MELSEMELRHDKKLSELKTKISTLENENATQGLGQDLNLDFVTFSSP